MVSAIQRYCIHDGDGIRTMVFLKGCQLTCGWCSNPESQNPECEIGFFPSKCTNCKVCETVCPYGAIDGKKDPRIQKALCMACGECVKICPSDAYQQFGSDISCEELLNEVLADWRLYKKSGGGVTVSGGERTLQQEFLLDFLTALKQKNVHTALETHGLIEETCLWRLAPLVDQFLFDVKHMDSQKHKNATGVGNEQILKNLRWISQQTASELIVRVPLIPGFNDDDENISQTVYLVSQMKGSKVHLLPFHNMASSKYFALNRAYPYEKSQTQNQERLEEILKICQNYKVNAQIGG